jgi:hypothetical protein
MLFCKNKVFSVSKFKPNFSLKKASLNILIQLRKSEKDNLRLVVHSRYFSTNIPGKVSINLTTNFKINFHFQFLCALLAIFTANFEFDFFVDFQDRWIVNLKFSIKFFLIKILCRNNWRKFMIFLKKSLILWEKILL